uniref:Uncharacterized protein n=1 Tax=Romanomermis culicivorax TaxID=13658 RepID=A0A915JT72_ROMCU
MPQRSVVGAQLSGLNCPALNCRNTNVIMRRSIRGFLLLVFSSFLIWKIEGQSVTFQTEALSKKTTCDQLTRNDCLFYHEAVDKCGSVCDDRIKNGDK